MTNKYITIFSIAIITMLGLISLDTSETPSEKSSEDMIVDIINNA